MLADRGLDETALPETVQGIIAARLDALSPEEKTAIQNGRSSGRCSGRARSPHSTAASPRLVRSTRSCGRSSSAANARSSVGGQDEYAFRHVLVRDVAYGQIPRARARREAPARRGVDRVALGARRGPRRSARAPLRQRARVRRGRTRRAGGPRPARGRRPVDRAELVPPPAIRYYRAALELLTDGDVDQRGEILYALGEARFLAEAEGADELEECVAILEERNPELAADALATLAIMSKQDQRRTLELFERALALVRDRPSTKEKASVLAMYGGQLVLAHEPARARELTQEAVEIAEELGDVERQALALLALGNFDDMERALQLAVQSNFLVTAARCYGNFGDAWASHRADVERCFALQGEGRRLAERIGGGPLLHWFTGEHAAELYLRGRWDDAVEVGERLVEEMSRSTNPHFIQVPTRVVLALIAIARDDAERAERLSTVALERGRAIGDLQVLYMAFASRAVVLAETGRDEEARAIVSEFIAHLAGEVERTGQAFTPWLERLMLAWLCLRFGFADELIDLHGRETRLRPDESPWVDMVRPILEGDLVTAAARAEEHQLAPGCRLAAAPGGTRRRHIRSSTRRSSSTARRARPRYVREAEELRPPRGCRAAPARARSLRTAP